MLYGEDGLRLNTYRFNIGAGGDEVYDYWNKERGSESFFKTDVAQKIIDGELDYSAFLDINNYDFTKDAGAVSMFKKALATGNVKEIVFFANSPHYAMTKSGLAHGAEVQVNNLKEDAYEVFSDYLLIITTYLYENIVKQYGSDITIKISPVNEPQWDWGGKDASQEGCHYDPEELAKFYQTFYTKVNEYNNANSTHFEMDIFESGNVEMGNVRKYLTEFEKYEFFESIDTLSVHSYGVDDDIFAKESFRGYIDRNYEGLKVYMSEYCVFETGVSTSIDMGIFSTQVLIRDLMYLNAVSWNYWLSVSMQKYNYEDGLVNWNENNNTLSVERRYYAVGQFSRYIEQGAVRFDTTIAKDLNGVEAVAYGNPDGSVVIVLINDSDSEYSVQTSGDFTSLESIVTTQNDNWKTSKITDGKLTIPAKSICTYVFSK